MEISKGQEKLTALVFFIAAVLLAAAFYQIGADAVTNTMRRAILNSLN